MDRQGVCRRQAGSLRRLEVAHDPVSQVHAVGSAEFKDVLFLPSWEHSHVSLNSCDGFQMCVVSFSLALSWFISHCRPNPSKLFFSLRPPLLHVLSSGHNPGVPGALRACLHQGNICPLQPPLSTGPCGCPLGSQGPSETEAVAPLLACAPPLPLCPSQTSQQTHTWF